VIALFDAADAIEGGLGAAVYNAGNNARGEILEMETSFFEDVWRVTCLGGFLAGREAGKRLVARGGGSILFTGATASLRGKPPFTAFASGKAALRSFAQSLAKDLGPKGVHVGHVVVDGGIHGEKILSRFPDLLETRGADGLLNTEAIAESFWHMHSQDRTAWTFELDLRPYKEAF
jgi:NAD(P)-dependent dehydrogenase (short-subunit alcohol dehydrogenase family)